MYPIPRQIFKIGSGWRFWKSRNRYCEWSWSFWVEFLEISRKYFQLCGKIGPIKLWSVDFIQVWCLRKGKILLCHQNVFVWKCQLLGMKITCVKTKKNKFMWVCIWNEMKCCNDELRGKFWNDNLKNHMCREGVYFQFEVQVNE